MVLKIFASMFGPPLKVFSIILLLCDLGTSLCCRGRCTYCPDCTRSTPHCATGKCNIFGCNCDGSCRHGRLCPIGTVNSEGQRVVDGPYCYYDRPPECTIRIPGSFKEERISACPGRRKRFVSQFATQQVFELNLDHSMSDFYQNSSTILEKADKNLDNKLDFEESLQYLQQIGFTFHQINQSFHELDWNGDKHLTISEFDS